VVAQLIHSSNIESHVVASPHGQAVTRGIKGRWAATLAPLTELVVPGAVVTPAVSTQVMAKCLYSSNESYTVHHLDCSLLLGRNDLFSATTVANGKCNLVGPTVA